MIKAYFLGKEIKEVREYDGDFVRIIMKDSGSVYEVPRHLIVLKEVRG